jgi:hypothetical protein
MEQETGIDSPDSNQRPYTPRGAIGYDRDDWLRTHPQNSA